MTHYVAKEDHELLDPPASTCWRLGWQACATMSGIYTRAPLWNVTYKHVLYKWPYLYTTRNSVYPWPKSAVWSSGKGPGSPIPHLFPNPSTILLQNKSKTQPCTWEYFIMPSALIEATLPKYLSWVLLMFLKSRYRPVALQYWRCREQTRLESPWNTIEMRTVSWEQDQHCETSLGCPCWRVVCDPTAEGILRCVYAVFSFPPV